jgi:sulfhydrogenase subunit beta (sulfur reductase)
MARATNKQQTDRAVAVGSQVIITWAAFALMIAALRQHGYRVIGPRVRDGAIVLDELSSAADLPQGVGDTQDGGVYRIHERGDQAVFGHAAGPQSWRRFLSPPRELIFRATRRADGMVIEDPQTETDSRPFAFIGVRACDLRALEAQDHVLTDRAFVDPRYAERRSRSIILAVNCTEPSGVCFCQSMGTGPRCRGGFDLSLTEVVAGEHRFVVEVGSELGGGLLADVPYRPAKQAEVEEAARLVDDAAGRMGRAMDQEGLRDLMASTLEHPRWGEVAEQCLACGNCTLVCPTCFCSTVEDTTDLAGEHAERWKRWDSCFTADFSYLHGGSVRASTRSRYRQWLTHKLGTWHDQFGTSGCVGCGRCIAWCPVGIDLTEEVAALRRSQPNPDQDLP